MHESLMADAADPVTGEVPEGFVVHEEGHGRIEGNDIPISIEPVERHVCVSGTIPIRFGEHGNVIDLGRESRLFSSRQKAALAARDGGNTDLADGVFLCRHHHMLVHNNRWETCRTYWRARRSFQTSGPSSR